MSNEKLFFKVYCVCGENLKGEANPQLEAIFRSIEDAAEWAEMKKARCRENTDYVVYGYSYKVDEPIKAKGGQDNGT